MRTTLIAASLFVASTAVASPPPPELDEGGGYASPPIVEPSPTYPPSAVVPVIRTTTVRREDPLATEERWGGGIRLTGLSGIGALPGVNFGGEVAGLLRRDELFVELALGRWKPEETRLVADTSDRVELALDVWTVRGGWTSMKMPLRAWGLVEVGEVAGVKQMPGVISRMVMGETPRERQWVAVGAGLGVAWPMSNQARLVGNLEFAVPVKRDTLMLDVGEYKPDPLAARYSIGLEVGWR
jgi:hypothetical protein